MKNFILTFLLFFSVVIGASAQVHTFRTTGYYEKHKYSWGWGNWTGRQDSNMTLTINYNTDVVTIYSPKTQVYRIYRYGGTYKDNDGDVTAEFKFYDQDGDRGTMRLVIRNSTGKSQIYIDFANVCWAYDVVRTN